MPRSLLPNAGLGHTQRSTSKLAETLADIQRVTVIEDAVLRNLWITQCYQTVPTDLDRAMS